MTTATGAAQENPGSEPAVSMEKVQQEWHSRCAQQNSGVVELEGRIKWMLWILCMQLLSCNRQPVCSPGMSSVYLCPVSGKGSLRALHLQVKTEKERENALFTLERVLGAEWKLGITLIIR